MARPPYHIARQEHLGDMLDELQAQGLVAWRWEYDVGRRRAVFSVQLDGKWAALDTLSAERAVQAICDDRGVRWRPVPHPGGETLRADVQAWKDEATS